MIKLKDNVVFKGLSTDAKVNDVRIGFFLSAIKHIYGDLGNHEEIISRVKEHFNVTLTTSRIKAYFTNKNSEADTEALHKNLGFYEKKTNYKHF